MNRFGSCYCALVWLIDIGWTVEGETSLDSKRSKSGEEYDFSDQIAPMLDGTPYVDLNAPDTWLFMLSLVMGGLVVLIRLNLKEWR